jgi:hypothetical protein
MGHRCTPGSVPVYHGDGASTTGRPLAASEAPRRCADIGSALSGDPRNRGVPGAPNRGRPATHWLLVQGRFRPAKAGAGTHGRAFRTSAPALAPARVVGAAA